jgi:hypothetical protein
MKARREEGRRGDGHAGVGVGVGWRRGDGSGGSCGMEANGWRLMVWGDRGSGSVGRMGKGQSSPPRLQEVHRPHTRLSRASRSWATSTPRQRRWRRRSCPGPRPPPSTPPRGAWSRSYRALLSFLLFLSDYLRAVFSVLIPCFMFAVTIPLATDILAVGAATRLL